MSDGCAFCSSRDWRRYATKMAAYAFGLAGDVVLARTPRREQRLAKPPHAKQREDEAQRETSRLRMR